MKTPSPLPLQKKVRERWQKISKNGSSVNIKTCVRLQVNIDLLDETFRAYTSFFPEICEDIVTVKVKVHILLKNG